jgi:RNA polymerase sigma-70 factor (ECF subfamily)
VVVEIDDGFLVEAARAGDVEAFAALVRRYEGPVYRVALRMLGSEADAQDAAQEAFVRAWRGLGRFRRESAVSTWLYRIVTRRCLDLLAARRDTQPLEAAPAELGGDPAEAAERRERLRAVTGAIGRLPAEQRAALVLREFEGLPYDAIAEVLDTTLPTVKGRIHRARLNVIKETARWR